MWIITEDNESIVNLDQIDSIGVYTVIGGKVYQVKAKKDNTGYSLFIANNKEDCMDYLQELLMQLNKEGKCSPGRPKKS